MSTVVLDPGQLGVTEQRLVAAWLEDNGCEDWIALDPIEVRRNRVTYSSLGRKGDDEDMDRHMLMEELPRKTIKVTTPMPLVKPTNPLRSRRIAKAE